MIVILRHEVSLFRFFTPLHFVQNDKEPKFKYCH